jgi:hypothetical protein
MPTAGLTPPPTGSAGSTMSSKVSKERAKKRDGLMPFFDGPKK